MDAAALLHIKRNGSGDDVQSLHLNGQPSPRAWLHFPEIANGATLAYRMGATPGS